MVKVKNDETNEERNLRVLGRGTIIIGDIFTKPDGEREFAIGTYEQVQNLSKEHAKRYADNYQKLLREESDKQKIKYTDGTVVCRGFDDAMMKAYLHDEATFTFGGLRYSTEHWRIKAGVIASEEETENKTIKMVMTNEIVGQTDGTETVHIKLDGKYIGHVNHGKSGMTAAAVEMKPSTALAFAGAIIAEAGHIATRSVNVDEQLHAAIDAIRDAAQLAAECGE